VNERREQRVRFENEQYNGFDDFFLVKTFHFSRMAQAPVMEGMTIRPRKPLSGIS
jgi:hypothetical protein